jgi:hypothetical protein
MRKLFLMLLVAILAGSFIAACGGDDDDQKKADAIANQIKKNLDKTTGDTSGDDNSGDDNSGDNNSSSGDDDLTKLLEEQSKAHIAITYETKGSFSSDGDTLTIIQDGKDRSVYISGDSEFITADGKTISCDNLSDTPTCSELPAGMEGLATAGLSMFTAIGQGLLSAGNLDGVDKKNETIAGRRAVCVEYDYGALLGGALSGLGDDSTDVPTDAKVRICVDKETGFLLEFSGEGDGDSGSFKATEVREPRDSDFDPPAEVTDSGLGDLNLGDLTDTTT